MPEVLLLGECKNQSKVRILSCPEMGAYSMREWYFSSSKMTIWVHSDVNDIVSDCAPIARKFIGQKIKNLADWMRKQGDFRYSELKSQNHDAKIKT